MERKVTGNFRRLLRVWVAAAVAGVMLPGVWGCSRTFTPGYGKPELDSFLATVRPFSHDPARLLRNAHYLQLMGRRDLALKELEEAYARHPDNLKLLDALARNYEALGDYARSRQLYQEALGRHPEARALANNFCFTYYLEGKWPEAEKCFKEVLARDSKNETARNNLGLLYLRLGREGEAYSLWKEAGGDLIAQNRMQQARAALGQASNYARPASVPPAPLAASQLALPQVAASAPGAGAPGPGINPVAAEKSPAPAPIPARPEMAESSQAAGSAAPIEPKAPPGASAPAGRGPQIAAEFKPTAPVSPTKPQAGELKPAPTVSPAEPQAMAAVPRAPEPKAAMAEHLRTQKHESPPIKAPKLTAPELTGTKVLVLNGAGIPDLARHVRSMLQEDGYNVAGIGNHINFGADRTIIYYRAEARRVAQALNAGHFPKASLVTSDNIRPDADVKIVLGKELEALEVARMQTGREDG